MGASGVIMFSILPADPLGAQDEIASEAITNAVKTIKYTLSGIPCEASLWDGGLSSSSGLSNLFTIIFTEYQSACLTIYIRNNDLVTFDKLAKIGPVTR